MCVEGQPYPVIDYPIHGEHDGVNFKFLHHSVCKLQQS